MPSHLIDLLIGFILASATIGSARLIGFDKDKAFYSVLLIFIAVLYVIFGATAGRFVVLVPEIVSALVFVGLAVAGYKHTAWWLVVGYALHGGWDIVHDRLIQNAGVPLWWPEFCLGYDISIAVYLVSYARKAAGQLLL